MIPGFAIEVIYVDGRVEKYDYSQEQTTIGSSMEADLCIPLNELSPKHLLIVPRAGGCWVSVARGVATPVLYGGRPLDGQEVPWGAELDVGTITLRIGEPTEKIREREKSQRSLLRLMGLVLLVFGAFYLLQEDTVLAPRAPASAPDLFDESVTTCAAKPGQEASRARELSAAGGAYWQRYPFDPQEGMRAAKFYGEAKACFNSQGDTVSATKIGDERRAVVEHVNKDYQTLRLQLSRALKNKEHKLAKDQVRTLSRFVRHRPGKYFDWLVRVDRYLQSQKGR